MPRRDRVRRQPRHGLLVAHIQRFADTACRRPREGAHGRLVQDIVRRRPDILRERPRHRRHRGRVRRGIRTCRGVRSVAHGRDSAGAGRAQCRDAARGARVCSGRSRALGFEQPVARHTDQVERHIRIEGHSRVRIGGFQHRAQPRLPLLPERDIVRRRLHDRQPLRRRRHLRQQAARRHAGAVRDGVSACREVRLAARNIRRRSEQQRHRQGIARRDSPAHETASRKHNSLRLTVLAKAPIGRSARSRRRRRLPPAAA